MSRPKDSTTSSEGGASTGDSGGLVPTSSLSSLDSIDCTAQLRDGLGELVLEEFPVSLEELGGDLFTLSPAEGVVAGGHGDGLDPQVLLPHPALQ